MFIRPKNLLSKGVAGLLLLASKAMADGNDASDVGNQIAFYASGGVIIAVACCACYFGFRRQPAPADNNYYGLVDQIRDLRAQDDRAAAAGNFDP